MLNCRSLRVFGHIVCAEGRCPDPTSVASIMNIAPPSNITDVKSICGLANVDTMYRDLLSRILEPIQQLQKKGTDVKTEWDPEVHGVALTKLKQALTTAPILLPPDILWLFRLLTDACKVGHGLGAILMQTHPVTGVWHPVQFWSKALSDAERNYSATELECKCVHDAIIHWGHYLRNQVEFEVVTDHYALVYMLVTATKSRNGRLEKYIQHMQDFNFSVTHRSGSKHLDADAISRLFHYGESRVDDEEDIAWRRSREVTEYDLQCIRKYLLNPSTADEDGKYQQRNTETFQYLRGVVMDRQQPHPAETISEDSLADPSLEVAGALLACMHTSDTDHPRNMDLLDQLIHHVGLSAI